MTLLALAAFGILLVWVLSFRVFMKWFLKDFHEVSRSRKIIIWIFCVLGWIQLFAFCVSFCIGFVKGFCEALLRHS